MSTAPYLQGLNHAQLQAVLHPPTIPLQILAGPGSGKTKVLTTRIAHLITQHDIEPASICAVTFTNKAANEMRERLTKLLGKSRTCQIKMGTFHALCASFLRRYAKSVGLEGNFTVCDADESKKIVTKLLKPYKEFLEERNLTIKETTVMTAISKAKAKGRTPDVLIKELDKSKSTIQNPLRDMDYVIAHIYKDYDKILRKNNSLDFDDLLVFGVKLFSQHKTSVAWCRHVLVDEFQDTNIMQYDLMVHIAAANKCVTIVGDPDQSIYGWRSAEVENLSKMQKAFPTTKQILLEQNYRSTAAVLAASIAIVDQDKKRVPKTLHTSHPTGNLPVLQLLENEHAEAAFIASEIKRIAACMGGLLNWNDFVVLLRFNALSRTIESALQKEGIPSRVLAGHKFFERLEVKDLLAYLQLIDNPTFVPAFTRAINTPGRGIGDKTINELLATAERLKLSPLEVTERIYDGRLTDIKPAVKRKLTSFIGPLRELRTLANTGASPSYLIRQLLELTEYELHLKKTQSDWESRWDNVQELLNFAIEVEREIVAADAWRSRDAKGTGKGKERTTDIQPNIKKEEVYEEQEDTPLRAFLQASMLSTDTETKDDEKNKDKVTISTCHAAKGLEWPVVMIPAVERGTFPSSRAEDIEEERRLLYVACTRAQGLLYLSYARARMFMGVTKPKQLSEFVQVILKGDSVLFSDRVPEFQKEDRVLIAKVLQRPPPDVAEVARRIHDYNESMAPHEWEDATSYVDHEVHDFTPYKPAQQPEPEIDRSLLAPFQGSSDFFSAKPSLAALSDIKQPGSAKPRSRTGPLSPSRSRIVNAAAGPRRLSPALVPAPVPAPAPSVLPSIRPVHVSNSQRPAMKQNTHASPVKPLIKPSSLPSPVKAIATSSPSLPSSNPSESTELPIPLAGTKRRLGMGRTPVGYTNKKFKMPTPGGGGSGGST